MWYVFCVFMQAVWQVVLLTLQTAYINAW